MLIFKVYCQIDKGSTGTSPKSNIQGRRVYFMGNNQIRNFKQSLDAIKRDFCNSEVKGFKKGKAQELKDHVRVIDAKTGKDLVNAVESRYKWRGKDAFAIRIKGRFVTWGLVK